MNESLLKVKISIVTDTMVTPTMVTHTWNHLKRVLSRFWFPKQGTLQIVKVVLCNHTVFLASGMFVWTRIVPVA